MRFFERARFDCVSPKREKASERASEVEIWEIWLLRANLKTNII